MALDIFGVTKLKDTVSGGKEWFSTSFNTSRQYSNTDWSGVTDTVDPSIYMLLEEGANANFGNGIVTVTGQSPRVFIWGPWLNTEVTTYIKAQSLDYVHVGSRANHEVKDANGSRCGFGRYNVKYDHFVNRIACDKEQMHPFHVASSINSQSWPEGFNNSTWTGIKTITQTDRVNNRVLLQGYVDHTGGINGGTWIKKTEWFDDGTTPARKLGGDREYIRECTGSSDRDTPLLMQPDGTTYSYSNLKQAWFKPGRHIWFRIENCTNVSFKSLSIREISYYS